MTVKELIEQLKTFDNNCQVMILDGFNGGGNKRELNLGPTYRTIRLDDIENTSDCEDIIVDEKVVVIGYGCY